MKISHISIFIVLLGLGLQGNAQAYFTDKGQVQGVDKNAPAKYYKASLFGIKSDGVTLNTNSIQYAIDFISNQGGGKLLFYVGRYLTGTIQLKSNVSLQLEEGAILASSPSIYDYSQPALIVGRNVHNVAIFGKGVVEGNAGALMKNISAQKDKGYLTTNETQAPALLQLDSCSNVAIRLQNFMDAAGASMIYNRCANISIDSAALTGGRGAGIVISDSKDIRVTNVFLETGGEPVQAGGNNENISLTNTVTSDGRKVELQNGKPAFSKAVNPATGR